ncbi:putative hydratase [Neohortaea acidophila]|uniref:Putative hydratase n=1 Tax=Neohortaea acidophila TaxID=245834 RepID=A0A6A6PJ36_9PEZI|nr:putative hydratase [Neohortaea acidophila]KAF2479935.1 putative hydratase [Neohortaea acidophila]
MADTTTQASDTLIEHWQKGTTLKELVQSVRPSTTDYKTGYDIQRHVERITEQPLFGWKIAATSAAGQKHINSPRPLAGRILEERVERWTSASTPPTVPLGANRMLVAELEFVFKMAYDLPPRGSGEQYDLSQVMAAVQGLYLGSELPDSRFEDFTAVGPAQLIADNACADRFVLGPEAKGDWRAMDLPAHRVRGWAVDGTGAKVGEVHEGNGAAVLGDPKVALTWLVNELNEYGLTLRGGEYVTTGTCIIPIPVKPGDTLEGDYGELGTMTVKFAE